MESNELYRHLLGLSKPWTVERVELDMARGHVGRWRCMSDMRAVRASRARNAAWSLRCTTIRANGLGGIWIAASF